MDKKKVYLILALVALTIALAIGIAFAISGEEDDLVPSTTGSSEDMTEHPQNGTETEDIIADPSGATEDMTDAPTQPAGETGTENATEPATSGEDGDSGSRESDSGISSGNGQPENETKPMVTEPEETNPQNNPSKETQPKETEPEETAHKHSYSKKTVNPTCTERGYDQYTCSCGDSYRNNYKDAKGHSYQATTVNPTCSEQGYTQYKCSTCGDSYKDSYTDALGHSWGEWVTIKEPTTSEEGTKERSCTRCSEKETASIAKKEAEKIDTATLEAYGRRYAYETYGYDGNPNCNPSTGAGYFPGATKYIYTMEEGYKLIREAVNNQYANDVATGKAVTKEVDGVLRRCKLNVYIEPTNTPNRYVIWVYYGGHADPYCD